MTPTQQQHTAAGPRDQDAFRRWCREVEAAALRIAEHNLSAARDLLDWLENVRRNRNV